MFSTRRITLPILALACVASCGPSKEHAHADSLAASAAGEQARLTTQLAAQKVQLDAALGIDMRRREHLGSHRDVHRGLFAGREWLCVGERCERLRGAQQRRRLHNLWKHPPARSDEGRLPETVGPGA